MERIEIEVFSQDSNYAIVRMPGRKFPGCVIQGDSLRILLALVDEIQTCIADSTDEELIDLVSELKDDLLSRLRHYQAVLKEHDLQPPYTKEVPEYHHR